MKSFVFKNDGPIVKVNGSPNRTVWFQVTDVNEAQVRAFSQLLLMSSSRLPRIAVMLDANTSS